MKKFDENFATLHASFIKHVATTFHYTCIAVQFTYIPSPNIEVYQLAHYQYSVDHINVGITWYFNGTVSTNEDIIQLGIVTIGAGSPNSSLTIPGYPQYNNTVVTGIASGLLDAMNTKSLYYNSDNATLRIQGNTLSDICHYISSH